METTKTIKALLKGAESTGRNMTNTYLLDGTGDDCVILDRVKTRPGYDVGDRPRGGWYLVQVAGETSPRLVPACLVHGYLA